MSRGTTIGMLLACASTLWSCGPEAADTLEGAVDVPVATPIPVQGLPADVGLRLPDAPQPEQCPPPPSAAASTWQGPKVLLESAGKALAPSTRSPISLSLNGGGPSRELRVQWSTSGTPRARLTRVSNQGVNLGTVLEFDGAAARGTSMLRNGCTEVAALASELSFEHLPGLGADTGPVSIVTVKHSGGNTDYGMGSSQGVVIALDGDHAVLVGKASPWDVEAKGYAAPQVFAALLQPDLTSQGWGVTYSAPPLTGCSLPGLHSKAQCFPAPSGFSVRAGTARRGGGLFAGGEFSSPVLGDGVYVFEFDGSYALARKTLVHVGTHPQLTSLVHDPSGQVIACGSFESPGAGAPRRGFVAKIGGSGGTVVRALAIGDALSLGGCAAGVAGQLLVTGSFTGTHAGLKAAGADVFVARLEVNAPGTAPSLMQVARLGTLGDEVNLSAPLVDREAAYVAGVTNGEWGPPGSNSLFLLKLHPDTLRLY
jgi:hypothetical protein